MNRYIINLPTEAIVNADGRCSRMCPSLLYSHSPKVFPHRCDLFKRDLVGRRPCFQCELMRHGDD